MAPTATVSLDRLREQSEGITLPLETHYRKSNDPATYATPSKKIEIWSETLRTGGYSPLPDYVEAEIGPFATKGLAEKYPLVLTCTKTPQFCHSQHRSIPSLRKLRPEPTVEIHPDAAASRKIAPGDWVVIDSPSGRMRGRAKLKKDLDARVVCAEHGWWQSCEELGLPGYDALDDSGANFNRLIAGDHVDPVSGSTPLRSYLCEVTKAPPI